MSYVLRGARWRPGRPGALGRRRGAAALPRRLALGDLLVNLTGCLLIGVLLAVLLARFPHSPWLRPFLAVGVLGGFTTYSTFAVDVVRLTDGGAPGAGRGVRAGLGARAAWPRSSSACSPAGRSCDAADTVDAELRAGEGET